MKYRTLGATDIKVSEICLGTMTFGVQNDEADGHAQLDRALELGVNFVDTAEMYPFPRAPERYGRTEQIIGSWLAKNGRRDRIVLATKVSGPGLVPDIREGAVRLDRRNIMRAVDSSLKRLGTDYIDLYQVHWPDRNANYFGKLGFENVVDDPDVVPIEETLEALTDVVKAGKVRHIGVSNETAWGTMRYLELARHKAMARVETIQNPYNLLNRSFEVGLAEVCLREQVSLLPYSPLCFGVLTGKYLGNARPEGARLTLFPQFVRYLNSQGVQATEKYVALARAHDLLPEQMSIAYLLTRPFVASVIIGATTLEQLERNIGSVALTLPEEVLEEIEHIHHDHTYPCP
ncbi:MAG: NADP(H)-dependent aldo-keto reductase [Alphaproteobacteria bacterium]|nr:MAG: NADP(H)-dependent aldo-keto reductase [Alphaproteobacteria bacterium]